MILLILEVDQSVNVSNWWADVLTVHYQLNTYICWRDSVNRRRARILFHFHAVRDKIEPSPLEQFDVL